jgi:hypothetical protein
VTARDASGDKTSADKAAQDSIEGRKPEAGSAPKSTPAPAPAAGPHADSALTNEDATPGSGYLPSPGDNKDAESPGG